MNEPRGTEAFNEQELALLAAMAAGEISSEKQACLLAIKGPDKGAVYRLHEGSQILGRSRGHSDLVLTGYSLSRAHARVVLDPTGKVNLYDLNSTNGSYLNGRRVEEAEVQEGDTIRLGADVELRLDFQEADVQNLIRDLHRGATLDSLTNVLNRRSFMRRLEEEFAVTQRHRNPNCVAILDIDHFKSVNDTHGHPAGDAVIQGLASILQQSMRTEDLVGRYGGEEFVLLVRQTPMNGAMMMLERLRAVISELAFPVPTPDGPRELTVTVSMGVADLTTSSSAQAAVALADQALYRAKQGGRNRVCAAQNQLA